MKRISASPSSCARKARSGIAEGGIPFELPSDVAVSSLPRFGARGDRKLRRSR